MILEAAILDVVAGRRAEFEAAFSRARRIIESMPGFISLELGHCLEHENRYLLLIRWKTLEDHTVGFRGSREYSEWKKLLHHFYSPFPEVEHYASVCMSSPEHVDAVEP